MDLLIWFRQKLPAAGFRLYRIFPLLVVLALTLSLTPVADTLWAETLMVSGEVQTGSFEESPTRTETATPTPTTTPPGQAGTTLQAYKTADSRWKADAIGEVMIVYGRICVMNGGERTTEGLIIFDQVEIKPRRQAWQPLAGATLLINPPEQIPPGEVRCYEYEIEASYQAQAAYRNSARVTILNHSGWLPGGNHCPGPQPCPFGPEVRDDFEPPSLDFTVTPTQPPASPPPLQPSPTPTATATPLPTLTPQPTETPLPPSATAPQPTETPIPPSATAPQPTETPLPPSATAPPPTETPLPPTATPPPPTQMPPPADTPTPVTPPPGPPPIHDP